MFGTAPRIKEECLRGETTDAKLIEQLIKEEKISVLEVERDEGRKAQNWEEPISEVMDKLSDLGVKSPLEKDEVMEGYDALRGEY